MEDKFLISKKRNDARQCLASFFFVPKLQLSLVFWLVISLSACHRNTLDTNIPNQGQLPPFQSKLPNKPLGNCIHKLTEITFSQVVPTLEKEGGDASKLILAKKIVENNCLSASQIQRMMETFQFESSRLDFILFAYPFCFDPQSYRQFSAFFKLQENKQKLEGFLNTQ